MISLISTLLCRSLESHSGIEYADSSYMKLATLGIPINSLIKSTITTITHGLQSPKGDLPLRWKLLQV